MDLGPRIAEGKTKVVYAHPTDQSLVVLTHKDGITAGDGARRSEIPGKGALAGRTTANVFRLLAAAGVATHFVEAPEPNVTVARRCTMIPLEVVTRRLAAGSYLRRNPDVAEGARFEPPLVEFFLKDDAAHDPLISVPEIIASNHASAAEVEQMIALARRAFAAIERAWAAQEVTLVDLKIEFGRTSAAELLVADVIDNDSWRIWPAGDKSRMLDKQLYRDATAVDDALLAEVYARYEQVAELTGAFARREDVSA
jgi:phosphoribosylaminoimidazole-succinocarboxamide synthase